MELTMNDFFCGCGGMAVGFKAAGYQVLGAWDFDDHAVKSYAENVDKTVQKADIRLMTWRDIPKATVWTFGFPCQDLSVAGEQAGFELGCKDCGTEWKHESETQGSPCCPKCGSENFTAVTRSAMFFEIMRLLKETRENAPEQLPAVLVAENVKGLRKYLQTLTEELAKNGYIAHVELYNSKHFEVAQSRERYYIVATRADLPDTLRMPDKQEDNTPPKPSDFLDDNVDEKYYIPDERAQAIIAQALERLEGLGKVHATLTPDRLIKRQNGRRAKPDEEEMYTLTAQDIHGVILAEEDVEKAICEEIGINHPDTAIAGGGTCQQRKRDIRPRTQIGITVSKQAKKLDGFTDVAGCLLARDYKGFGNQQMTAVLEIEGGADDE